MPLVITGSHFRQVVESRLGMYETKQQMIKIYLVLRCVELYIGMYPRQMFEQRSGLKLHLKTSIWGWGERYC